MSTPSEDLDTAIPVRVEEALATREGCSMRGRATLAPRTWGTQCAILILTPHGRPGTSVRARVQSHRSLASDGQEVPLEVSIHVAEGRTIRFDSPRTSPVSTPVRLVVVLVMLLLLLGVVVAAVGVGMVMVMVVRRPLAPARCAVSGTTAPGYANVLTGPIPSGSSGNRWELAPLARCRSPRRVQPARSLSDRLAAPSNAVSRLRTCTNRVPAWIPCLRSPWTCRTGTAALQQWRHFIPGTVGRWLQATRGLLRWGIGGDGTYVAPWQVGLMATVAVE